MAVMAESCGVCGRRFDVQFRYQMEERDGAFAFYCSHDCHQSAVSGEGSGGATCAACQKRFAVELVSQVVRVRGGLRHACSEECRQRVLAEVEGARPAGTPPPRGARRPTDSGPLRRGRPASVSPPALRGRRRLAVPPRLAVFNHKGGTGKTTTSVTLAAGLAARGLRVLLVDTDSQGSVAAILGVQAEKTLYHVLVMGARPSEVAMPVRPNLDVILSNETLAAAELYLAGRPGRDRILRERLAPAFDDYDALILDCSPSLSLLNQNALVAADAILVPVACDFLSLVGVRQVQKTVKNVNTLLYHPVQIQAVLPTFYDARARICRDALQALHQHFGSRVLAPIRQATRIKEAPEQGKTIFEYAPDSSGARDYGQVVDWLVEGPPAASPTVVAAV